MLDSLHYTCVASYTSSHQILLEAAVSAAVAHAPCMRPITSSGGARPGQAIAGHY